MAGERVAIFLPSLRGGGAEHVMATLANAFCARGLAVDLVLAMAEGPFLDDIDRQVRIVDLKATRVLSSLPRLIQYMRQEKPRAMLSALSHANAIAIVARRLAWASTRLVISERGVPFSSEATPLKTLLVSAATKTLYPHADEVVAVSSYVASVLAARTRVAANKLTVIHNPIDIEAAVRLVSEHPAHQFISGQFSTIVSVGRLEVVKAPETLLRAIGLLRHKAKIRALFLGEGPLRDELEELARSLGISQIVDFVGFQRNPLAWIAASNVFVLSSRYDAMPNAMLQALACGVPIVSTDCPGGAAEILENGRWGRLVPVNDPASMADAIEATLNDPNPPDVKERAKCFSLDSIAGAYLRSLDLTA